MSSSVLSVVLAVIHVVSRRMWLVAAILDGTKPQKVLSEDAVFSYCSEILPRQ